MMFKKCYIFIIAWITFGTCLTNVLGLCTFQPPFNNSVWYDNTKGTLTFGTQYMSGWSFKASFQTVRLWQCVNSAIDNFLIMRTQLTFRYEKSGGTIVSLYGYLCLELTNITDTSYIYYQRQVQINDLGERLKLSPLGTLDYSDICSNSAEVPASEYHVLVKSGSGTASAITCPNNILFIGDYTYQASDTGQQSCNTSADLMDVCSDNTTVVFNYTTCPQKIAFSAGGVLLCVANVNSGGYDYLTLLNMDTTFTSDTSRFSCLSTDGSSASVAIGNCTATQTPYTTPTKADGTTTTGHLLFFNEKYSTCGFAETTVGSSGLTGGEIAGIVVCILLIAFAFFLFISCVLSILGCLCTAELCFIICDATDPEKPKSPVSLPDIATELQNLKLNQDNVLNGGPHNSNKNKPLKVTLHEGRHDTILPPLKNGKGNLPMINSTVAKLELDEKPKSFMPLKRQPTDNSKDRKEIKLHSDRTHYKIDVAKDMKTADGSPRKHNVVEKMGLSPRKGEKNRKKN